MSASRWRKCQAELLQCTVDHRARLGRLRYAEGNCRCDAGSIHGCDPIPGRSNLA